MIQSRAAVRYAKALLQQAKETQVLAAVAADMHSVLETLEGSIDFQDFLRNPTLTASQKLAGFEAVFTSLQPLVILSFKIFIGQ